MRTWTSQGREKDDRREWVAQLPRDIGGEGGHYNYKKEKKVSLKVSACTYTYVQYAC